MVIYIFRNKPIGCFFNESLTSYQLLIVVTSHVIYPNEFYNKISYTFFQ